MPFILKLQWDIKAGREADFRANREATNAFVLNPRADTDSRV